jgi:hypothetical protein
MTNQFLTEQQNEPNSVLIPRFFSAVSSNFIFLEKNFGYKRKVGIIEFQANDLIYADTFNLINPDTFTFIDGSFYRPEVRFIKDNIDIVATFSGRESVLSVEIRILDSEILSLWEVVNASAQNDSRNTEYMWVSTSSYLEKSVRTISEVVHDHINIIEGIDSKLRKVIDNNREKRYEKYVEKRQKEDLERDWIAARNAFKEKDFTKVIKLISPHEKILTSAQQAKLKYSRSCV